MNDYLKKILILSILLLGLIYPQQFLMKDYHVNDCTDMSIDGLEGIIGVMVEFDKEIPDDLRTSGDGQFITIDPSIDDSGCKDAEYCEDLSEEACESLNHCEWNDDNSVCEDVEYPEHCEDLGEEACESLNHCEWHTDDIYPSFINYDDLSRCSKTLLETPPHNSEYFESQLKAVINYYQTISHNQILSDNQTRYKMINEVYTAEKKMEYYAQSENRLTELYAETILQASNEIITAAEDEGWGNNEFIVVVFHAGLGQDLGSPGFDPTIYDIHSAYIDSNMMLSCPAIEGSSITITNNSTDVEITRTISNGILLPETLNPIYYDVIEDMYSTAFADKDDLEDAYCYYQTGMTGLFAYFLGYRLCMPPMHSIDNIYPVIRIGRFGLMDVGAYNRHGIIPAPPNIWTRTKHDQLFSEKVINKTEDIFFEYPLAETIAISPGLDNIYRIDITNDEYFLIEHRSNLIKADNILNNYSITTIIDYLDCDSDYSGCDSDIQNALKSLLLDNKDLDDIDLSNVDESEYYKYWLDIMQIIYNDNPDFVMENGVVTNFPDYDHGLPGSGILIWHIKEPLSGFYDGINNDRYNKAITLEEGDGMSHLGFYDPDPFGSSIPEGWEYDFWYNNNRLYRDVNDIDDEDNIYFGIKNNKSSIPNSNTSSGINSNISIEILSDITDEQMEISVQLVSDQIKPIFNIDQESEEFRYLGNNGNGLIYYEIHNVETDERNYYSQNLSNGINTHTLLNDNSFNAMCSKNGSKDEDDKILYFLDNNGTEILCHVDDASYYIVENTLDVDSPLISPIGYFDIEKNLINGSPEELEVTLNDVNYALADFDNDGLDEVITVSNGSLSVYKENTGIIRSGFPLYNDFLGIPLVADIDGDSEPEIICKTSGSILVVSNAGDIINQLPLYDLNHDIVLIPADGDDLTLDDPKVYLVNGNRLYAFNQLGSPFWLNPYSTTYNYPLSGVSVSRRIENWELDTSLDNNILYGIDMSRAFNYPNPFVNETIFRFFVGSSNTSRIKVYNAAGFLVDNIEMNNLHSHQYNEYVYITSKLTPGVYFAEIKSDKNESKLIKLLKKK